MNKKLHDLDDVTSRIWSHIENVFGSQRAAAIAYGVDEGNLSAVLSGKKPPGKQLLDALNMRAVIYYEDVK